MCPFNRKVSAVLFVVGRLCAEEFVCLFTERSVLFSLLLAASAAEKSVSIYRKVSPVLSVVGS